MNKPLFSVILPTYDRKEYFVKALNSILNQKNEHWELLIINDGNINLKDVIPRDKRINYIENNKNLGASASRNIGIKLSKGEYIAYLDDDDEWLPDHLSISKEILFNHDFIYSGSYINKNGVLNLWYNEKFSYKRLAKTNFIPTPTVIHKKNLVYKAGLWNEHLKCLQDWDLWCRMLIKTKKSKIYHRDDITVIINWGHESITTTSVIENIRKKTIFHIKLKYYLPLILKDLMEKKE